MDDPATDAGVEPVVRRGLIWPIWTFGLIGILCGIVYIFVVAAV